jgi:cytochrome c-type biogenesis protein CcmH/NrfG
LTDSLPTRNPEVALPWSEAERLASRLSHLGSPAAAQELWTKAIDPPSRGIRHARIGDTWLASLEIDTAVASYQDALALEPALGDAWFGLALARLIQGRANDTLDASRKGLTATLTTPERESLKAFAELVAEATLGKPNP